MTITARQTSTRIHAIRTLVDKLATLPLAVGEIHRAIDLGIVNQNDRPKAENARGVAVSGHSDPTALAALKGLADHQRYLDKIESDLRELARAAGDLCDVVSCWVVSATNQEEHPICSGGAGYGVQDWTDPTCGEYVSYRVRDDGSLSYRSDGLCDACRMRRHRWLKQADDAA